MHEPIYVHRAVKSWMVESLGYTHNICMVTAGQEVTACQSDRQRASTRQTTATEKTLTHNNGGGNSLYNSHNTNQVTIIPM